MLQFKKFVVLLVLIICFSLLLSSGACLFASDNVVIDRLSIYVPSRVPVVDGDICANEGWNSYIFLSNQTLRNYWHANPLTTEGRLYFSYNEVGLYFAAEIVEGLEAIHPITGDVIPEGYNEFISSTDYDDIDVYNGSGYGWNGDVFGLMLDPLGEMRNYGFTGNADYSAWYLIGLFEDGTAGMYREKINVGDITDLVQVEGHKTDKGWTFEACIPWNIIISDIKTASGGEIVLNKNNILKPNSLIRASAMYHDRVYDHESGVVTTWGRFMTSSGSSGDNVFSYGLKLYIKERGSVFSDVKPSAWYYGAICYVVENGYMNGMSSTIFSPNSNITREQFVLILANIAGVDTNEYKNISSGFADVPTGQWYSGAVTWAVERGYVSGMSSDKFGRGQSIQRAALARMLYNYASKNGINVSGRADLSTFGDAVEFEKSGNAWMREPIQWAVDAEIISGMTVNGKNCVNPKGTATRAQAARMLMQFDALLSK